VVWQPPFQNGDVLGQFAEVPGRESQEFVKRPFYPIRAINNRWPIKRDTFTYLDAVTE
jgi:hypothetical protein